MALLPMLIVDSDQAVSNYVAGQLSGVDADCGVCCSAIESLGFTPPLAVADQWWYDASVSASADFYGAAAQPDSIMLSKGWASDSGFLSSASRTLSMTVILRAANPAGLAYGIDAFAKKVGVDFASGRCSSFAGAIYTGCDVSLYRSFCAARVLDMVPSAESGAGCEGDVAAVFDLSIEIEGGCMWGDTTTKAPVSLRSFALSTPELCNPGAVDPASACGSTFSVTSCPQIPEEFRCGPTTTVATDPTSPLCDPYCPPLFIARTIFEFTGLNPAITYSPSFEITAGIIALRNTEVLIYPSSVFTDLGFGADDDDAAAIGMCVEPYLRARIGYLEAITAVTFDGICGETTVDCGGGVADYEPEELWSPSGVPVPTALDGAEDWTFIVDTKLDQAAATLATAEVALTACYRA